MGLFRSLVRDRGVATTLRTSWHIRTLASNIVVLGLAIAVLSACTPAQVEAQSAAPRATEPSRTRASDTTEPRPGIGATTKAVVTRPCGEFGREPTKKPIALDSGTLEVGSVTLQEGKTARVGSIDLVYDRDMMFGTTEVFSRGPGLRATVDPQVEPLEGAYGGHAEIAVGRDISMRIGPYVVEGRPRTVSGVLPDVDVKVLRPGCATLARADWTEETGSLWLGSVAATHQHLTDGERTIEVSLMTVQDQVRLLFNDHDQKVGFDTQIDLRPDSVGREIDALGHVTRIAAIEVDPAAKFVDGKWQHERGEAVRMAVRLDLRRTETRASPVTSTATEPGCGEAATRPLGRPEKALAPPRAAKRRKLTVGTAVPIAHGKVSLEHNPATVHHHRRRGEYWTLSAHDPAGALLRSERVWPGVTRMRIEDEIVRLQTASATAVEPMQAQSFTLACPSFQDTRLDPDAQDVWLGTHGLELVILRAAPEQDIYLALGTHGDDVNLSVGRLGASYHHFQPANAAGDTFVVGDRRVEVLEVLPAGRTSWAGDKWKVDADGPHVLVHLRVSPLPAP
jgi:hypothetical protein